MGVGSKQEKQSTYELYREIAAELSVAVDPHLSSDIRYELYQSKVIYLKNLYEQCFRAVNSKSNTTAFTPDDLILIKDALEATHAFMRETILESLQVSFATFSSKVR